MSDGYENLVPTASQRCPVCKDKVTKNPRYPRYLCRICASQAADESGRPLEFSNTHITGGFEARYAQTQKIRRSHVCFVKGIRCRADEARYGGIVIQTFNDSDEEELKALARHYQDRAPSVRDRPSLRRFIRDLNKVSAATTKPTATKEGSVWRDDIEFVVDAAPEPHPKIDRDLKLLARSFEKIRTRMLKSLGGKNWLEKLPRYDPLLSPIGSFGVIDLGLRETAHTRMLGWLMDPRQNHGFNDVLLRYFLQELFELPKIPELLDTRIDCESVSSESKDRLDICMHGKWRLADGKTKSWLVIVEAKIDAGEGEDQCDRYEKQCHERVVSSDLHAFVFLTPNGLKPKTGSVRSWKPFTFIRLMALCRKQLHLLTAKPGFNVLRHYMTDVLKDLYQLNCGKISGRDDLFRISEYLSLPRKGAKLQ